MRSYIIARQMMKEIWNLRSQFITPNIEYILYKKDDIHAFKNRSRDKNVIYKKVSELLNDRKE